MSWELEHAETSSRLVWNDDEWLEDPSYKFYNYIDFKTLKEFNRVRKELFPEELV